MIGTSIGRSARQRSLAVGLSLAALLVLGLLAGRPAHAATFTVNSTGDGGDVSRDGVCDSNFTITVTCTLRAAIQEANATTGADTINFGIGADDEVKTISPASKLPDITDTVTIDGYTQPGASEDTATADSAVLKIELNGAGAGGVSGLTLNTRAGGTTIRGIVINRFDNSGVIINTENTVVEGNFIGTDPAGDADLGNGLHGVVILSSGNLIGGTSPGAKNVISGNFASGVIISGSSGSDNRVEGNRIGTNASGTSALGNQQGVTINAASGNFVGGPEVGASNLISANRGRGVLITGGSSDNKVESNRIGIDGFGGADLGNGADGVEVFEGSNNVIGGTVSRTGNIISGNDTDGVELGLGATGNRIEGNLIGTGQNGASDLGNGEVGVLVRGSDNTVGGTVSGARNVVSGNGGVGVSMIGNGASNNAVQGNLIGTRVDGVTPLANFHGVFVSNAADNTIGGSVYAAANTISGNLNHGVILVGANATGNSILRNSISNNGSPGGLGVELNNDGVTLNDNKDFDAGPNKLQNFPVITSATTTKVTGKLNSRPGKTFKIQLFSNPQPNFPTGFGEGATFLGQKTVRTNDRGKVSFTFTTAVSADQVITATATDASGNTSEFSQGRFVE